jgi:pimeloyl-ACP methyl ester carboxylesterase
MEIKVKREGDFSFVEEGEGRPLILLHGLFGALSNWRDVVLKFSNRYRVLIPMLPIYEKTGVKPSVAALADFVKEFVDFKGIAKATFLGNSLGGHVAQLFALANPHRVEALVLTGSSGLFESGMGSTFPRRGNYQYIKERVQYTFYSPETATQELIDEVFEIVNDNYKTLRILKIARAAQRQNLRDDLNRLTHPVLLVWGLNDNITPVHVAHEFDKLLPNSTLRFVDQCGHAAMMEQPERFNEVLEDFLNDIHPLSETA